MLEQIIIDPEEEIIEKIILAEYISRFDPEIQTIFYDAYGKTLEAMPHTLLQSDLPMERFFEYLLMLKNPQSQRLILMRLGIVSGTPMTLQEIAEELGITRERVRQVENIFRRRMRPPARHTKRIRDFYC